MRRFTLLTTAILFTFYYSFGQTNVSGVITSNTTWTKANSPYNVTGNVIVNENVALTIEPGVVVQAKGHVYIDISGSLIAEGTQSDSIYFKGNGTRGFWTGIKIRNNGGSILNSDYSYNSGSKLSFVKISDADAGIYVYNTSIYISNVTFINNKIGCENRKTTISTIKSSDFISNDKGAYVNAIPYNALNDENNPTDDVGSISDLKYSNCNFSKNQIGVFLEFQNNGTLNGYSILNSTFDDNVKGVQIGSNWGFRGNGINILNNLFKNNSAVGLEFSKFMTGTNNVLSHNLFYNNRKGFYQYASETQLEIKNNIFYNNDMGIDCFNGIKIQNSVLVDNNKPVVVTTETSRNPTKFSFSNSYINNRGKKSFSLITLNPLQFSSTYEVFSNNFNNNLPPIIKTSSSLGKVSFYGNYINDASKYSTYTLISVPDSLDPRIELSNPVNSPILLSPISVVTAVEKSINSNLTVLKWSSNSETDIKGYKIYYGGYTGYSYANVIDVGNVTTFTLPSGVSLDDDIAVTAYDIDADGTDDQFDGNESWYSPANKIPAVPNDFTIDSSARKVKLTWSKVDNATNYNVYRSTDNTTFNKVGSAIATSYVDSDLTAASRYYYKITAFDSIDLSYDGYGLESGFTDVKAATPTNVFFVNASTGNNSNIGSLANPYLTIQSAIDASQNGDSIILARGTYYEAIDLKGKVGFLSSNYYLTGDTADINNTILSGKNNGNTNLITNTINCYTATKDIHVSGLTLTDTRLRVISLETINCTTSFRLTRSIVKNSGSYGQWGVIGVGQNGSIDSCTVFNNRGRYVLSAGGSIDRQLIPKITNNVFYNNTSSADGTLYEEASTLFIEGRVNVINNLIYKNKHTAIGFGANGSDSALFVNNTVVLNSGHGIRFETWGGNYSGYLINNISSFNKISDISANTKTSGPGYYLKNNFFGKNGLMNETNLLSDNNTYLDTTGNIGGDPFFTDTTNNDFTLQGHSPAIGAGTTTKYLPAKDLNGNIRINPWRTVPDIGAYESSNKFTAPFLTKSEPGNKKIQLFWTQKNVSNIIGYRVYRSAMSIPNNFNEAEIATVNSPELTFIDSSTSLLNKTKYYYRLKAIYNDNQLSGFGSQITAVPNVVNFPANTKVDNSPKFSRITWDTVPGPNVKYQLFRGLDSTNQQLLKDSISTVSFVDTTLARNTFYYYRLKTIDSAGALSEFTPAVQLFFTNTWYIDSAKGSDANIGSKNLPYATISKAVGNTLTGDSLLIEKGTYADNVLFEKKKLKFIGQGPEKTLLRPKIESNIFYFDQADSTVIKGMTLFNASSKVAGSAIQSRQSTPVLENIIFRNNGGAGGVIMPMSGSFVMNNCLSYDNTPNTFFEFSNSVSSTALINHFTYYNNTGNLFNSGLPTYKARFTNSIIWDTKEIVYSGVIEVENSIFKGGFPNSNTVLDLDPQFVDIAKKNFKIKNYSPAIGLGDPAIKVGLDIEGKSRPNPAGTNPDAGVYESEFSHAGPRIVKDSSLLSLVKLEWKQEPLGKVEKVIIYKGTDSLNLAKYDTVDVAGTYSDSKNKEFNKVLFYAVSSTGTGLNESGISNMVRTIALNSPVTKENILGPQDSTVTVNWAPVPGAGRYRVQISLDSTFKSIDPFVTTDSSYQLDGLLTNSSYFWRVQALDSTHTGSYSPIRSFKTRLKEPIITGILPGNKIDTLSWSANKNINVKKYYIYRDTTTTPSKLLDSVGGSTLQYIDTIGLVLNVKYYYAVAAVDSSDVKGPSSQPLSATPYNRKPLAVKLDPKSFNDVGNYNTVRVVYSALGSTDPDGKIVGFKWFVNDSVVNSKDSVLIHYFQQGNNNLKLEVMDNDSATAVSETTVSLSSFNKTFSGGFLGGITALDKNNLFIADSTYDPVKGASVYKIDKNGKVLFPLVVSSKIFTTPSVSSDSSLFITNGSSINGFNYSGAPLWPTISLGGLTYVTPTIDSMQNRLYIGVSNSNFFAIDYKTGKVVWNLMCDAAINSSAVITAERKLIFVSNNGTLYGFDLITPVNTSNPTPKWKKTFVDKPSTSPALDSLNNVYFGTGNGKLMKLKLDNNGNVNEIWSVQLDKSIESSPVIDARGYIYVGSTDGNFFKVNPADGAVVWKHKSSGGIKSTPAISDFRSIYIADMAGVVTSLNEEGKVNWTYKTSAPIAANILYIDNIIYMGTKAGNLIGLYDNPSTNTVNTSLGFLDKKVYNKTSSLANVTNFNSLYKKVDELYDAFNKPSFVADVEIAAPVWGTFQGNFKRTGSRAILCPDKPLLNVPKCTNYADSFLVTTNNMTNKLWVVNQNVLSNNKNTSLYVKNTDNVKLMAFNDFGCTEYSTAPVYFIGSDLAKPKIETSTGTSAFCSSDTVKLTSSIQTDKYVWKYMNQPISGATNRSFTSSIAGSYTLTVENKYGCTSTSDALLLQTLQSPSKPSVSDNSVCQGVTALALSATPTSGNSLLWYGANAEGGVASVSATVPSSSVAGVTKYYVSQRSINGCESERAVISFTVHPKPEGPSVKNTEVCVGASAAPLDVVAAVGNSLIWYGTNATGGAGSTVAPKPSTAIPSTAKYYVSQMNLKGCESERVSFVYTVNEVPKKPEIIWNGAQLSTSTGYASYQWFFNNNVITGAISNSVQPTGSGNFKVKVTNTAACADTSAVFNLLVTALTNPIFEGEIIRVYPNPVINKFTVDLGQQPQKAVNFKLFDKTGALMGEWNSKQKNTEIAIDHLPKGIYLLQIQNNLNKTVTPLLKQ